MSTQIMSTTTDFTTLFQTGTSAVSWSQEDVLWVVVVGFIVGFILSFAVGANDVANSFGTTVGAKALTLRQACILATIFETSGAVLIGAKVGETIRKGIIDVGVFEIPGGPKILMVGEVSAMIGSGIWQLVATKLKVPVSGTHSIVGACIGFSLVAVGPSGVNWSSLAFIVASWFISPLISGISSVALFYAIQKFIIHSNFPLRNGLRVIAVFYAITIGINLFSILYSGAPLLGLNNSPIWAIFLATLATMIIIGLITQLVIVPRMRKSEGPKESSDVPLHEIEECGNENEPVPNQSSEEPPPSYHEIQESSSLGKPDKSAFKKLSDASYKDTATTVMLSEHSDEAIEKHALVVRKNSHDEITEQSDGAKEKDELRVNIRCEKRAELEEEGRDSKREKEEEAEEEEEDPPAVRKLFSTLQIITACFASFAHGGNDVSNAIGPLVALWIIFSTGEVVQDAVTPWYILFYGGLGISVGLWLLGKRVMETIGQDITKVTPSRGFCIELTSAAAVLVASNVGIPISTTHCKVGAVVSIGWFKSRKAVDWSVARNIAFAWFVTVPVSGLISAGSMWLLLKFISI